VFRVHEPYKTTGFYGLPKGEGLVRGDPHPLYDAVLDVGPFNGATFIRPSAVEGDITANTPAAWLTFDVNVDAKVHVAFPRASNSNNIPSWLNGNGWVNNGQMVKAVRQEYRVYTKEFAAGTVTLGPNDGTTITNLGNHYLTIVEPANVGVRRTDAGQLNRIPLVRVSPSGLSVSGLAPTARSVRLLDTRGRMVSSIRTEGRDNVHMPTANLAAGTYVVRVDRGQSMVSEMVQLAPK
jgi:hypothetical protein